jgi:DNA-binding NtrC family response regulator
MSTFGEHDELMGGWHGSGASPAHESVLIIDDDPSIRESLTFLLADRYEVSSCSSASEGVSAVNDEFCAIVLDVKMPGRDGFWACTEIRKKVPDVPVIFYSAYQNLKDPYAVINDHHPFGYVAKGGDVQKLLDMLAAAVDFQAVIVENRKLMRLLKGAQAHAH